MNKVLNAYEIDRADWMTNIFVLLPTHWCHCPKSKLVSYRSDGISIFVRNIRDQGQGFEKVINS